MYTKIKDAYKCNHMNLNELQLFIHTIKNSVLARLHEQIIQQTMRTAIELLDENALWHADKDLLSLWHPLVENEIIHICDSTVCPTKRQMYKLNYYKTIEEYLAQMRQNIAHSRASVWTVCKNSILQKYETAKINRYMYNHNAANDLILFPKPTCSEKDFILFQTAGTQAHETMNKCITMPYCRFQEQFSIEDYSTDKQDIPKEELEKRKTLWNIVMPSGIPSNDGIVIHLTNFDSIQPDKITPDASYTKEPHYETVLHNIKNKNNRMHNIAKELTTIFFWKTTAEKASYPVIMNTTKDQIKAKSGKHFDKYLEYCSILSDILQNFDTSDFEQPFNELFNMNLSGLPKKNMNQNNHLNKERPMDIYSEFHVEFLDPDIDVDDESLPDDAFYGYKASIPVKLPDDVFTALLEQDTRISQLESNYGILDVDGDTQTIGFDSYEIEMKNAPYVFQCLCEIIKDYVTGTPTETFIPLPK